MGCLSLFYSRILQNISCTFCLKKKKLGIKKSYNETIIFDICNKEYLSDFYFSDLNFYFR